MLTITGVWIKRTMKKVSLCDLGQRYGSSFLLAVGSVAATLDQGTVSDGLSPFVQIHL
jgi:hypothetical protein